MSFELLSEYPASKYRIGLLHSSSEGTVPLYNFILHFFLCLYSTSTLVPYIMQLTNTKKFYGTRLHTSWSVLLHGRRRCFVSIFFFSLKRFQMLAGGGDSICVQKRGGAHVRIHHYEQVRQPSFSFFVNASILSDGMRTILWVQFYWVIVGQSIVILCYLLHGFQRLFHIVGVVIPARNLHVFVLDQRENFIQILLQFAQLIANHL